jgi:glycosyltransferase involved in cell wall biosynthesis
MTNRWPDASCKTIGILSPIAPEVGGMPIQAQRLAEALRCEGIDPILIPVHGELSWKDRYPVLRTIHHYRDRIRRLREVATRIDGLIVFSCSGYYLLLVAAPAVRLCSRLNIPVVISDRGGDTDDWFSKSLYARRLFRSLSSKCKTVHVSSQYLKRIYRAHGIEAEAVPILIDTQRIPYRPRAAKAQLILNNRTISQFHGVPLSIRVLAELRKQYPSVYMTVTGAGCEFGACKQLVKELGLADVVTFTGRLSQNEMIELLDRADLVINTSKYDNIPNAVLEAFASGVAVISSTAGGIPDLIGTDERGYLVHDRSVQGYVSTIRRAIDDSQGTLARVERARLLVESLSWSALREDYLRVMVRPLLQRPRDK